MCLQFCAGKACGAGREVYSTVIRPQAFRDPVLLCDFLVPMPTVLRWARWLEEDRLRYFPFSRLVGF